MSADKISIIVDNQAVDGLNSEHGLSLLIDFHGKRTIFDTGQNQLKNNLKLLNINPSSFENLVLSHGHYDHSGGIKDIISINNEIDLYLHPNSLIPRYSIREGIAKSVKISANDMEAINNYSRKKIHWVRSSLNLEDDLFITGEIPRKNKFEDSGGPFFIDEKGLYKDKIEDDLALCIKTPKGLVIICGCCHSGIINTLNYIFELTGKKKIYAIIGGLHLVNAKEKRLSYTINSLKKFEINMIVPCHCTGEKAVDLLQSETNIKIIPGYAGYDLKLF